MLNVASPCPSRTLRSFGRREDGALIVFTLFMIVAMLLCIGIGVDVMRTEVTRTKLQQTADRAVLAAADLEQDLDAKAVVADYFERNGLDPSLVDTVVAQTDGEKSVTASVTLDVRSLFLNMVGLPTLPAPAVGAAEESVTDVEIAVALDNSGSMGWNNDRRLNLLKPAARDFVDTVIKDDAAGSVAVSIVPFATQVNAGPDLAAQFTLSGEHGYSHCVTFDGASFDDAAVTTTQPMTQAAHFDIFTWQAPVRTTGVVCPFDASRHITPWSTDRDFLKTKIDQMWAGGNTSIDVAAKWGAALLDPAARPALSGLIGAGVVDGGLSGQPFDYGRDNTMKVLVVMSDGQNTMQYTLDDEYRAGPSTVWKDPATGDYSYFDDGTGQYYSIADATWKAEPDGGAAAVNLAWPELLNEMSVARYARDIKQAATGIAWGTTYDGMYGGVGAGTKNARASKICEAAKNEGVIVFTIGMDTYGQGDATLLDCASSPAHFFDVDGVDIDQAFSAIARQINQLRLTQ